MDFGGDPMGDIAFDSMAVLAVIMLAACIYQVFSMACEEVEKK